MVFTLMSKSFQHITNHVHSAASSLCRPAGSLSSFIQPCNKSIPYSVHHFGPDIHVPLTVDSDSLFYSNNFHLAPTPVQIFYLSNTKYWLGMPYEPNRLATKLMTFTSASNVN